MIKATELAQRAFQMLQDETPPRRMTPHEALTYSEEFRDELVSELDAYIDGLKDDVSADQE